MAKTLFAIVLMVLMAHAIDVMAQQVTCQDAVTTLAPCMDFLKEQGSMTPSVPCCSGVQSLNHKCADRPYRVAVCQCLKDAAPKLRVAPDRAKNLPDLCNVHLPFPIVRDIDCNKIP